MSDDVGEEEPCRVALLDLAIAEETPSWRGGIEWPSFSVGDVGCEVSERHDDLVIICGRMVSSPRGLCGRECVDADSALRILEWRLTEARIGEPFVALAGAPGTLKSSKRAVAGSERRRRRGASSAPPDEDELTERALLGRALIVPPSSPSGSLRSQRSTASNVTSAHSWSDAVRSDSPRERTYLSRVVINVGAA